MVNPTKRPLPTPPTKVAPAPPIPRTVPPVVDDKSTNTIVAAPATTLRPQPESAPLSSPTKVPIRSERPAMVRTPSEAMVKKGHIVSAALSKGTLRGTRSSGFPLEDMSRSSSLGSQSSEDYSEDGRKKSEEKSTSEKEAKLKDKEKKDKKDDQRKASASSSNSSVTSTVVGSSSEPIIISRGHHFAQKGNDDSSAASSPAFSASFGSSSPLSGGPLEPRRVVITKAKKPKTYITENASNYGQFADLLMRNRFSLMRALEPHVKRADLERLSKDFMAFFTWREITLDYIKSAIRQDVDASESEGTLFRTNTLLTAIMSSYCQRIGKTYLKAILGPAFQWLQESTQSFEIDPEQAGSAEAVKQNIFNVNYLANKFFKAILNSNDSIPFEIREIANTLQVAVLKRFPNSKYSAIGGFFFLRFVCPAVLAPELCDVTFSDESKSALRRPLVLVAKVLQQIANDQKFNEPYMEPLNELISKWTVKVHQFFDLLVQKDTSALHKERDRVLEQMKDASEMEKGLLDKIGATSLFSVHRFVNDHVQELVTKFSDQQKELGYNPAEELQELIFEMGLPPDAERPKARAVSLSIRK